MADSQKAKSSKSYKIHLAASALVNTDSQKTLRDGHYVHDKLKKSSDEHLSLDRALEANAHKIFLDMGLSRFTRFG